MDEDYADELDEAQSALDAPAKFSFTSWLSIQIGNFGDIADTVGKMLHDTALHLRWHASYRHQQSILKQGQREIQYMTGE